MNRFKVLALSLVAAFAMAGEASAVVCELVNLPITLTCSGTGNSCYTIGWGYLDTGCESTITIEKTGCSGTVWLPVASGIDPSDGSYQDCLTLGTASYKYRVTLVCGECGCTDVCQLVSSCLTCP